MERRQSPHRHSSQSPEPTLQRQLLYCLPGEPTHQPLFLLLSRLSRTTRNASSRSRLAWRFPRVSDRAVSQARPEQVAESPPTSGTPSSPIRSGLERDMAAAVLRHDHHLATFRRLGFLADSFGSKSQTTSSHATRRTAERIS